MGEAVDAAGERGRADRFRDGRNSHGGAQKEVKESERAHHSCQGRATHLPKQKRQRGGWGGVARLDRRGVRTDATVPPDLCDSPLLTLKDLNRPGSSLAISWSESGACLALPIVSVILKPEKRVGDLTAECKMRAFPA